MTEFFFLVSCERCTTAAPWTLRVHLNTNHSDVRQVDTDVCLLLRGCFLSTEVTDQSYKHKNEIILVLSSEKSNAMEQNEYVVFKQMNKIPLNRSYFPDESLLSTARKVNVKTWQAKGKPAKIGKTTHTCCGE